MNSTISCLLFIAIGAFIGFLFYRQRKLMNEIGDFYKEKGHVYREDSPVEFPFIYTDARLVCTNSILKPGMPYTLILGSRTANRSLYTYIGIFIPQNPETTDSWLNTWKQKVAERGDNWAQHSGVEKADKKWGLMGPPEHLPIVATRVNNGTMLSWSGLHIRKTIEARINDVLQSLK